MTPTIRSEEGQALRLVRLGYGNIVHTLEQVAALRTLTPAEAFVLGVARERDGLAKRWVGGDPT